MDVFLLMILLLLIIILVIVPLFATRYRRVPPDAAMIVFGNRQGKMGFTIVKGGGRFIMPIVEEVSYLPLDVRTLDTKVASVVTMQGVMVDIEVVAQIKISSDERLLQTAAEQLLHKSPEEISYVAIRSLEGHIRGVCARLTVEEINADRDKVAAMIQDVACHDLNYMGIDVVSVTIRDLADQVGYLDALGKKRTAEVKRDAMIGEAEAERDAMIRAAQAREEAIRGEAMAMSRVWRFGETYSALGKSIRVLARALEELNQQFGRDNRDVMSILKESGMSEEDQAIIRELLLAPGTTGDEIFEEKVNEIQEKLEAWKLEVEAKKKGSGGMSRAPGEAGEEQGDLEKEEKAQP